MNIFPKFFSAFLRKKDQSLSDSQIKIFQRKLSTFSENDFRKVRQTLETVREKLELGVRTQSVLTLS